MSEDVKTTVSGAAPDKRNISLILEGHESPPAAMGMPVYNKKDTYQDLERKYRHRTYQAQELMVEKVLRGHCVYNEALEHKLRMFDLKLDEKNFMVVLVRPAGNEHMFTDYASDLRDGSQVGLIVSTIFSELLGEQFSCFPSNLDDKYAFLLNFADTDQEKIIASVAEICRDAARFIKDNFMLALHVCVSDVCDGLRPVHDAFREAEMVSGDPNTVYTEGVCVRSEGGGMPAPKRPEPSIEKQYLNALVTQDFQTALQLTLDKCRALYMEDGRPDLERVKMFASMRLYTTRNVVAAPMLDPGPGHGPGPGSNHGPDPGHGPAPDGPHPGDELIRMENMTSYDEVEKALVKIFTELDHQYNTVPSDYTGTTGKVISLIGKKYMEPDLSVEMICDCLGKSRSYLSRMFKENTGMNLLDYLHTTRLTEAKKLLNETDLGISEIAAKVGYYSGWTLARVFKRYEGITPTAYRKAFCNNTEL